MALVHLVLKKNIPTIVPDVPPVVCTILMVLEKVIHCSMSRLGLSAVLQTPPLSWFGPLSSRYSLDKGSNPLRPRDNPGSQLPCIGPLTSSLPLLLLKNPVNF